MASLVCATLMPFAVGALGPFLVADLGISRVQVGAITTVVFAVAAASSPAAGSLVDRTDRAAALLVGLFAMTAAVLVGAATVPSYVGLLAVMVPAGLVQGLSTPVANSLVVGYAPPAGRGLLVGVQQGGVSVSAIICGLLLPPAAALIGWRTAVGAAAALPVLAAVVTTLTLPARPPLAPGPAPTTALPLRGLVAWSAGYALLMGAGMSAVNTYLPLFAHEQLGVRSSVAGITLAVAGAVAVVARLSWGALSDRGIDPTTLLIGLAATALAAQALLMLSPTAGRWLLWPAVVALGASALAWNPVVILVLVRDVGREHLGRASALMSAGFFLGLMASPAPIGAIVDGVDDYRAGWAVLAVTFLAACAVAVGWRRSRAASAGTP